MKAIKKLKREDIHPYNSNIDVWSDENECHITLYYDKFRDENDHAVCEHTARTFLAEEHDIVDDAQDMVIDTLYTYEWIIADDEVWMYKVDTYQALRADEKGIRWMTHAPADTEYYKHEIEDITAKHLPKGFKYDEETEQFSKDGEIYELVNENDGTVSLVSASGIIHWF